MGDFILIMGLRTQIIVGFPGETQKEFEDTLRLIGSINVDFFEVYPYSPRMGTSAAKMKHQNTIKTIRKREYIATKVCSDFFKAKTFCDVEQVDRKALSKTLDFVCYF